MSGSRWEVPKRSRSQSSLLDGVPWYVRAQEPKDDELGESSEFVNVFGEFNSEADARTFAIDLDLDNGWDTIVPLVCDRHDAELMATDKKIIYPYHTTE
jgi:hypothetical protein